MRHRLHSWVTEVIKWGSTYHVPAEDVAELIIDALSKGGDATTTPPDAGT